MGPQGVHKGSTRGPQGVHKGCIRSRQEYLNEWMLLDGHLTPHRTESLQFPKFDPLSNPCHLPVIEIQFLPFPRSVVADVYFCRGFGGVLDDIFIDRFEFSAFGQIEAVVDDPFTFSRKWIR